MTPGGSTLPSRSTTWTSAEGAMYPAVPSCRSSSATEPSAIMPTSAAAYLITMLGLSLRATSAARTLGKMLPAT